MIDLERLLKVVSNEYATVTPRQILGRSRVKSVAEARQISMFVFKRLNTISFFEVGEVFGRDRSTIVHNYYKIEDKLDNTKHPDNYLGRKILHIIKKSQEGV